MTKRTVPENAEHSPVNKGAAETFRPVACQCANATGRVPSLREAEAAAGPDARSHPETPRASLLPQSACASQAAPPTAPAPPCPAAGCSTGHSQARHSLLHRPVGGLQPELNDLVSFKHLVYFKPQGHFQKAEGGNFTPPLL